MAAQQCTQQLGADVAGPAQRAESPEACSRSAPARLAAWCRAAAHTFLAGLALTAAIVPLIAAVVAVIQYVRLPADAMYPLRTGLLVAAASWPVLAIMVAPFTAISRASARSYEALQHYLRLWEQRLAGATRPTERGAACIAHGEAGAQIASLRRTLDGQDQHHADRLRWVLATGYVDLWNQLHRAEEALILIQDPRELVRDALDDLVRLEGSPIPERRRLATIVRQALADLEPAAEKYADPLAPAEVPGAAARHAPAGCTCTVVVAPARAPRYLTVVRSAVDHRMPAGEALARPALQFVRRAINVYRDTRRDGLVRARNQLLWTLGCVGVLQLVLVGAAMAAKAFPEVVLVAAACYLVGAVTGVFHLLHAAASNDRAVEDFGLAAVRVLSRPAHAGIAAVLGVGALNVAPLAVTILQQGSAGSPNLNAIFGIDRLAANLLLAGIFGLTPELLFRRFNELTEQLKQDLKATQPSEAASRL